MKREDLNKKVLAIVDGSNVFSRKGCKFVTKREAIEKGYLFENGIFTDKFVERGVKKNDDIVDSICIGISYLKEKI